MLVFAVMVSFSAPFDLSVFAGEVPATGSEIHAVLYYIDPQKKLADGSIDPKRNMELVFQRGGEIVRDDHRNFTNYRLYTLVVTYEGDSASKKGDSLDARAYIRYYDANGKLRVFYNNYNKTQYYGGCMCSFNQVSEIALPKQEESD